MKNLGNLVQAVIVKDQAQAKIDRWLIEYAEGTSDHKAEAIDLAEQAGLKREEVEARFAVAEGLRRAARPDLYSPNLQPGAAPQPKPETEWRIRRRRVGEEPKARVVEAKPDFAEALDASIKKAVEPEPEAAEPETEATEDEPDISEFIEEIEEIEVANAAEDLQWKLTRIAGALNVLGPGGFDPHKVGAIIWRMTKGSRDGATVFEDWYGDGARDLWAKGFDGALCSVEEIYRAAAGKGWRYPLVLSANRLNQVAERSEQALVRAKAEVFQAASELVRPVRMEVEATKKRKIKAAVLHEIEAAFLKANLTHYIDFHHIGKSGDPEPCGPTPDLVAAMLSRYGNWKFPVVTGIITSPTLRPDGSVLATEGFDPATGLLVVGPLPQMPPLSARPSREDAERSLATLEGLLGEFMFCDEASKAAALSGMITLNVRGMLDCVPLHASTAPAAGTGKSFLFDICAVIASGDAMPIMAQGPNLEETEKRLNGEVDKGLTFFSIDNVTAPLGGDCLCQAIERPSYTYRFLGFTKIRTRKNVWSMFATGINLRIRDDLTRRALLIRMDAKVENPEKRIFAGNPFLAAQADRGRYIAAALTVVRAYMTAGRPGLLPGIGDPFAGWSDNVRSALVWLGKTDPVDTMEEGRKNDPHRQTRVAMLQAIFNTYKGKPRTAGQMVKDAKSGMLIPPGGDLLQGVSSPKAEALRDAIIAYADAKLDAQHLGRKFAVDRNNITDGLVLRSDWDAHNKINVWFVEEAFK